MPIYEVEISQIILVEAGSEGEATSVATESIPDLDWQEYDTNTLNEIKSLDDIHYSWNGECIPYGGDGNTVLKDILS